MPVIFQKIDKIKPAYGTTYRVILFLCKLLLVVDILITTMAAAERYISFIPDPVWSEEIVLTYMSYTAVLSTAFATRRGAHIRMTAFDRYLPAKVVESLDITADLTVLAPAVIAITVGRRYAIGIGSKGTYVSMLKIFRFWMYFPVLLAGVAMLVFEIETLYNRVKSLSIKEGME